MLGISIALLLTGLTVRLGIATCPSQPAEITKAGERHRMDGDGTQLQDAAGDPGDGAFRRSRWWAFAAAAVVVAVVAAAVLSAMSSSVPVGPSGPMPAMSMGAGRLAVLTHDVNGRSLRLPGGRPGALVFAEAHQCASCRAAVRAAGGAVRQAGGRAQLTVVMVDSLTSRDDVEGFIQAVHGVPARYVIDDRNGGLASILGNSELGSVVVYDARGQVITRPDPSARQILEALKRANR